MDLALLQTLWFVVIAVAIIFYAVLDGFDLGVGSIHLFTKTDEERRIFLNAIGPVWDGNEVWIVVVIGGLFAGFPTVYATIFSGFYDLLMVLIAGFMFRAAAIEFRSKRPSKRWRTTWDAVFSVASMIVAFIIGVILGNIVCGVPLNANHDYAGTFAYFLRPYPVLVGFTGLILLMMHGALYLLMKTEGKLHAKLTSWVRPLLFFFLIFYVLTTIYTVTHCSHMTELMSRKPLLYSFPVLAAVAILNILFQIARDRYGWAFISSCAAITFLLVLFGLGVFPNIVLSTIDPAQNSLTIYNSSSSAQTLKILLLIALIGVPFVIAYGFWIYRVFRGKVRVGKSSY